MRQTEVEPEQKRERKEKNAIKIKREFVFIFHVSHEDIFFFFFLIDIFGQIQPSELHWQMVETVNLHFAEFYIHDHLCRVPIE